MKIAQVVITQSKNGRWKVTVMSRQKTEHMLMLTRISSVLLALEELTTELEWEQLSL